MALRGRRLHVRGRVAPVPRVWQLETSVRLRANGRRAGFGADSNEQFFDVCGLDQALMGGNWENVQRRCAGSGHGYQATHEW
jgi:hypothetical protein